MTNDNRIMLLNGSINKALRNAEVETVLADNPSDEFAFYFCEEHQAELIAAAPDHVQAASHTLFTLASRTIGTENLKHFKCPVCAFQQFNWIGQIADVVNGE